MFSCATMPTITPANRFFRLWADQAIHVRAAPTCEGEGEPGKIPQAAIRSLQIRLRAAQLPPDFSASVSGLPVFRSFAFPVENPVVRLLQNWSIGSKIWAFAPHAPA
jgi:hypothetical protein